MTILFSKLEILSSILSSKNQMGLDLGYKLDVAAIPIKILSKFPDLAPSDLFLIFKTQRTSEKSPCQLH